MAGPYLLGIDMGTGGARAGVFDATGKQLGIGTQEWRTTFPRPSRAEQDPNEWWDAVVTAVRTAVSDSAVDADEIVALSMDATSSTVVVLDEHDEPLRPALLWMDVRAVEEAEAIRATDDPALKYCGEGPVSAEWGLPKAMWVKNHEPEIYAKAATICDETDWLVNKLSGKWTMSVAHAAGKYFYDGDQGGWPLSLYDAIDGRDIIEKYPPEVKQIGDVVGPLTEEAAQELGLSEQTLVVQGGIDSYVGAVGLGVAEPGKMALITGSSHVLVGQMEEPIYARGLWGAYTDATVPGYYTIDGGQSSTGSIVHWFVENFGHRAAKEAEERDMSTFDVLTEKAQQVPIGSEGLIMLDHFQGNRAPHFDPRSRGLFWGLTLAHTEGHFFRAILEGVCFGTEAILQTMRDQGFEPKELVVSGGAARNTMWLQMHADVSGIPVVLTDVTEGPALGSAMQAAVGAGLYPDLTTAANTMTSVVGVIEPDPEAHEEYKFNYELYMQTYDAMKDLMAQSARHYANK